MGCVEGALRNSQTEASLIVVQICGSESILKNSNGYP
jgi:hypothetical protein